jgi:hypothetical protein
MQFSPSTGWIGWSHLEATPGVDVRGLLARVPLESFSSGAGETGEEEIDFAAVRDG